MKVIRLEGDERSMGEAFGELERSAIHELYRVRLHNAIEQAAEYGGQRVTEDDIREIARRCLERVQAFSPTGYAEVEGVAKGANLSLDRVWAMNALTDLRDVAAFHDASEWARPPDGEGCSSFVVLADRAAEENPIFAQTWDLATSNMPFVRVVVRKPKSGPRTVSLTTVGCLSLIGLNEHGVAVGTTNLRTTDARVGVCYLDVIHRALSRPDFEAAVGVVEAAPRAGAHFFTVVDGTIGSAALIECSALRHVTHRRTSGVHVHTNHLIDEGLREIEAGTRPGQSTHRRKFDLERILGRPGLRTTSEAKAALADHGSGELSVCRHDYGGISTNGAVVIQPAAFKFEALHGPTCGGTWMEVAF